MTLEYRAELPWNVTEEDIERLRGFGEVRITLIVEGENRQKLAKELAAENRGWRSDLGDLSWWLSKISRGRKITTLDTHPSTR